MQIVTSFSSSSPFRFLTLRLFPPLPIFYHSMSEQLLLPTSVFYPPIIFNLLLSHRDFSASLNLRLFCPHADQGTLTTSAEAHVEGVQQVYCYAALTYNYAWKSIQHNVAICLSAHAHSLLSWLSSLLMDCTFVYLVHVGDVGSQVFGTVEQPIRPFYLNSFPHFRSTQVHTISALKYKRVVVGL